MQSSRLKKPLKPAVVEALTDMGAGNPWWSWLLIDQARQGEIAANGITKSWVAACHRTIARSTRVSTFRATGAASLASSWHAATRATAGITTAR